MGQRHAKSIRTAQNDHDFLTLSRPLLKINPIAPLVRQLYFPYPTRRGNGQVCSAPIGVFDPMKTEPFP